MEVWLYMDIRSQRDSPIVCSTFPLSLSLSPNLSLSLSVAPLPFFFLIYCLFSF